MLQEQQALTLRDFDDVTKRNRDLYERFTSVDIECNRVTEDLVAANGKTDQLRNECANLRAEKRIWEVSVARPGLLNISEGTDMTWRRAWKAVLWKKIKRCLWSVLTCRISWRTSRRCTMTLSARARMIGGGSRVRYSFLSTRGSSIAFAFGLILGA